MLYMFDVHDVKYSVGSLLPVSQTGKDHLKPFPTSVIFTEYSHQGGIHSVPAGYQITFIRLFLK